MNPLREGRHWWTVRTAMLLLLGIMTLAPLGATAQSGPAPTVGTIIVDAFDCNTGMLNFHVSVGNLPRVPAGTSTSDYPLTYTYVGRYEAGSNLAPNAPRVLSPTAEEAPYSGNVFLSLTVPTTNNQGAAISSIDLIVRVAYGGTGNGTAQNPTDISRTTYIPNCGDDTSTDALIDQVIAILRQIIRDQLGGA